MHKPTFTSILTLSTLLCAACGNPAGDDAFGGGSASAGDETDDAGNGEGDGEDGTESDGNDGGESGDDGGAGDGGGVAICEMADPCDCPDSDARKAGECEPNICDEGERYTVTNAPTDPDVAQFGGGHGIHAPNFFCDGGTATLTFAGAYLDIFDHGGARLFGSAFVADDGCDGSRVGEYWTVDVNLDAAPASVEPKRELADPDVFQPDAVTSTWRYFVIQEGAAHLYGPDGGGIAQLSHRPADLQFGFQLGDAANGKNLAMGASGWFFYRLDLGGGDIRKSAGDFNVDLDPKCPSEQGDADPVIQ